MTLLSDPIWDLPWVILAAVLTLVAVVATYRRRIAHIPPARRGVLMTLRILSWSVLVFAMFRPCLEFADIDKNASTFFIVADSSRSLSVKDGPSGLNRRESIVKVLDETRKLQEQIGKDIQIRRFDFDKELRAIEDFQPDATGDQTAIGDVLNNLPKQAQGKRIVRILLFSDGAQRSLPPYDADPRAAAARLAEQQIPVDTIGVGTSDLAETALDLIADEVDVSPTVFIQNTVVVRARIRALGAIGRELVVRLLIEDPLSAVPGQPPKLKLAAAPVKLRPRQNQEVLPVEVSFVARDPGEFKLTLEVVPHEGEALTANNSLTTYISVLKGGISVAYFDEERTEMKFIRRMDESPDIRLDFKPIRRGLLGDKTPLELEWFEPGKYDVYIIGSVAARTFGDPLLKKLALAVEQGAGLLMTGGKRSFGPGGYASTPLAELLPVKMLPTEVQRDDDIDPSVHFTGELQMLPTSDGLRDFVMRLDVPAKNLARWKTLPPLSGANKFVGEKALAKRLAETPDKKPLLVAQDVGRARTMAFAADSTWLWFLAGHSEEHQVFWQQTIMWLAHKDARGDEAVWLRLDSRRFRIGQPVGMSFGANDGDKRPIENAAFKVEVTGPDDQNHTLTPQHSGSDYLARFLETRQPGEYRVRVDATQEGQPIGLGTESRFIVYEQDLELQNPVADFALLTEISKITGGVSVAAEDLEIHLRNLIRQGLNVDVTRVNRVQLWDNWPLLATFAVILTLEWFLRKRWGMV